MAKKSATSRIPRGGKASKKAAGSGKAAGPLPLPRAGKTPSSK